MDEEGQLLLLLFFPPADSPLQSALAVAAEASLAAWYGCMGTTLDAAEAASGVASKSMTERAREAGLVLRNLAAEGERGSRSEDCSTLSNTRLLCSSSLRLRRRRSSFLESLDEAAVSGRKPATSLSLVSPSRAFGAGPVPPTPPEEEEVGLSLAAGFCWPDAAVWGAPAAGGGGPWRKGLTPGLGGLRERMDARMDGWYGGR